MIRIEEYYRSRMTCSTCIYTWHNEDEEPCNTCPVMLDIIKKRKLLKQEVMANEISLS